MRLLWSLGLCWDLGVWVLILLKSSVFLSLYGLRNSLSVIGLVGLGSLFSLCCWVCFQSNNGQVMIIPSVATVFFSLNGFESMLCLCNTSPQTGVLFLGGIFVCFCLFLFVIFCLCFILVGPDFLRPVLGFCVSLWSTAVSSSPPSATRRQSQIDLYLINASF